MPSTLPLELVLLILEGDFHYSKSTLSATSLVCSRWRPISQRTLFKKLTIRNPQRGQGSSTVGQAPLQSILRAPHLLRYTREVAIEDESWTAGDNDPDDGDNIRGWMTSDHEAIKDSRFWLRDDLLIPKVLGGLFHMGRIVKFSFVRHGEAEYPFEETVSSATMQAIFAICRSPRLQSLTLKGVPADLARLTSPALRDLCVERSIIGEREDGESPSHMRLSALTVNAGNASCDHFTREVEWLLQEPNALSQLATLHATLGDFVLGESQYTMYFDAMEHLLSSCRSIRSLNLDLSFEYVKQKPRGLSNSALLENLEDLKLSFTSSDHDRFIVPWIVDFLATLPDGCPLQVLELDIQLLQFQDGVWVFLDGLLADKKKFPALEIASLHIMMGRTQWVYTTDGDSGVRLPNLMENGLMQIQEAMEWTKRHWSAHTKML
ncbi:hypothetical protein BKA70DRAFT_725398 [Coprinopsis sp. MPI-PUGE-AT-0042]|nr:hypothetical protein BKA70DRAFT_725398 [Coprinopsis sp. MPI-PUGE-AT-0042]